LFATTSNAPLPHGVARASTPSGVVVPCAGSADPALGPRRLASLFWLPGNRESHYVLPSIGDANNVPDVDYSIQRAEDELLRMRPQLYDAEMPLAEVGVFTGFNARDLQAIEPYLKRASYPVGAIIFRESERGKC
jgi:hypothetical protein